MAVQLGRRGADGAGLLVGVVLDRWLGDPQTHHPVAAFGHAAGWLEQRLYADRRGRGVVFVAVAVGVPSLLAVAADRAIRRVPGGQTALLAACTWAAVGGRQLGSVAMDVHDHLLAGELASARGLMPWLVGRDTRQMDAADMARATVESVAENTADAVVGPLVWGALAGPGGVVAYRAINTLDAMVGHHSPTYERFGWAAARLDDVANLLPSRVTAAITVLAAGVIGGRSSESWLAWRRDGGRHPSPNAGPVEAAMAGALGRTLGGPLRYGDRTEVRGPLGAGPPPAPADIPRVVRLSQVVTVAAATACALVRRARPALLRFSAGAAGTVPACCT